MEINTSNVMICGSVICMVGDIITVARMQYGKTEVITGRITSINQDDFWIDYSKEYEARQKGIYFDDVVSIKKMEWRNK